MKTLQDWLSVLMRLTLNEDSSKIYPWYGIILFYSGLAFLFWVNTLYL